MQHPACFSVLMSGWLGVGGREVLGWKLPPRPLPPFSAVLTHLLCSKPCICQECGGGGGEGAGARQCRSECPLLSIQDLVLVQPQMCAREWAPPTIWRAGGASL